MSGELNHNKASHHSPPPLCDNTNPEQPSSLLSSPASMEIPHSSDDIIGRNTHVHLHHRKRVVGSSCSNSVDGTITCPQNISAHPIHPSVVGSRHSKQTPSSSRGGMTKHKCTKLRALLGCGMCFMLIYLCVLLHLSFQYWRIPHNKKLHVAEKTLILGGGGDKMRNEDTHHHGIHHGHHNNGIKHGNHGGSENSGVSPVEFSVFYPSSFSGRGRYNGISSTADTSTMAMLGLGGAVVDPGHNNPKPAMDGDELNHWRNKETEEYEKKTKKRALERRERTSRFPPAQRKNGDRPLQSHSLHHFQEVVETTLPTSKQDLSNQLKNNLNNRNAKHPVTTHNNKQEQSDFTARLNEVMTPEEESDDEFQPNLSLCGSHAQSAALKNPQFYSNSHFYLNEDSRVVITGILSNPLGFQLALTLYNRCDVGAIVGIDPVLPNTVMHRLNAQRQLSILTRLIPSFDVKLNVPFMGVASKPSMTRVWKNIQEGKPLAPEFDVWEEFEPTHIVHLSTLTGDLYRRNSGGGVGEEQEEAEGGKTFAEHSLEHHTKDHTEHSRGANEVRDKKSAAGDANNAASSWWNVYGPSRPFNQIRQSMVSMEQLLHSMHSMDTTVKDDEGNYVQRPNLVYASSLDVYPNTDTDYRNRIQNAEQDNLSSIPNSIHGMTKLMDEVIASTYASLHGIHSVGLRFAKIYGPWDYYTAKISQMAERAVLDTDLSILPSNHISKEEYRAFTAKRDLLFVDDAVNAVIAAMQYHVDPDRQKPHNEPTGTSSPASPAAIFNIASGTLTSLESIAQIMQDAIPRVTHPSSPPPPPQNNIHKDGSTTKHQISLSSSQNHLGWKPTTSLPSGILKLLAWHYESNFPFGPAPKRYHHTTPTTDPMFPSNQLSPDRNDNDGEQSPSTSHHHHHPPPPPPSLQSIGLANCPDTTDLECNRGLYIPPCASECSQSYTCTTSDIFDNVILQVIQSATESCKVVLYTDVLGKNIDTMPHKLTAEDEATRKGKVCNVAFIPKESDLAYEIVNAVPMSDFYEKDEQREEEDEEDVSVDMKFEKFNGMIDVDGWTVIWLSNAIVKDEIAPEDQYLLKLAPGKLFHDSVDYAMYVDKDFVVTPSEDDVMFLVSQLHREALPERFVVYETPITEEEPISKKIKYKLPAEPERRSIFLAPPIRKPKDESLKISLFMATKVMLREMGIKDIKAREPEGLTDQREYYDKIASFINKDDQRSIYEPLHRFALINYIRTRWIVHDLSLQEGWQLRCEWYTEHTAWGNTLDQLSFAFVMARRELERNIRRKELDHREKAKLPTYPEELTDKNDWYKVLTDDPRWSFEVMDGTLEEIPDHIARLDLGEEEEVLEEQPPPAKGGDAANAEVTENINNGDTTTPTTANQHKMGLYTRIMSDNEMLHARKAWVHQKKELEAAKRLADKAQRNVSVKDHYLNSHKRSKKDASVKDRIHKEAQAYRDREEE